MSKMTVTLIDVGWGDSILIESEDSNGEITFGLIDSNDTKEERCSHIFLKRYFEKAEREIEKPMFEFVLLTHGHTDHGRGLKGLMREFGTKELWYPKSLQDTSMGYLLRFANRSSNVGHHEGLEASKPLPDLGDISMNILWPLDDQIDDDNENDNSVVLQLRLGTVSFVLTGDAEEAVWQAISIPDDTLFFKVPHHGSVNGTFDDNGNATWFAGCPSQAVLGISSHVRPFQHPHDEVIRLFEGAGRVYFRTDRHYHLALETHGQDVNVKYWH